MSQPVITRKEIASAAGVSEDTVRRRQKEWGLNKCKSEAIKQPIAFFRDKANRELIKRRVIEKPI